MIIIVIDVISTKVLEFRPDRTVRSEKPEIGLKFGFLDREPDIHEF